MLTQQLVDLDHGRDRAVLLDRTDADRALGIAGIGHGELVLAGPRHDIAERRIAGNAAPEELRGAGLVLRQLADELDLDDPKLLVAVAVRRHRGAQRRNQRERDRGRRIDLEQRADFRALDRGSARQAIAIVKEQNGMTAGDRNDAAEAGEPVGRVFAPHTHQPLHRALLHWSPPVPCSSAAARE